jgi:hypothetical protein
VQWNYTCLDLSFAYKSDFLRGYNNGVWIYFLVVVIMFLHTKFLAFLQQHFYFSKLFHITTINEMIFFFFF